MSQDINAASNHYPKIPITYSNICGKTEAEVTAQDGWLMSNAVEWLVKARLFETTVAHIIIFSGALFILIGLFFGVQLTKNNPKVFTLNGVRYEILGVAEMNDAGKKMYTPVYEVKK